MSIFYILISRNNDCCLADCTNARGNYKLYVLEFLKKFKLNSEKNSCSISFGKKYFIIYLHELFNRFSLHCLIDKNFSESAYLYICLS